MNMITSNGRVEMDFMWVGMSIMLLVDIWMVYIHFKMHNRVRKLEDQLKNKK